MKYLDEQLENIQKNSIKNYHVKGFDYICLNRCDDLTEKVYFFDGDASALPEVVNPHNHRYDFVTRVLCGAIEDRRYIEDTSSPKRFNRMKWFTPLNGGKGFEFDQEVGLSKMEDRVLFYFSPPLVTYWQQIHTIEVLQEETVIQLIQLKDQVPLNEPTYTYTQGEPPELDGLYEQFTMDELIKRLSQYERLKRGVVL